MDWLCNTFPKNRDMLPPAFQKIYETHYKENREGRSNASKLSQKMESWMHKKVAEDIQRAPSQLATLEIGAGTLNHLPYEPHSKSYDIIEPFDGLFAESQHAARLRHIYRDITDVPEGAKYDRIISIATLEHICNLPELVARSALLLNESGQFRAGIPSEGTILWSLGWKLTTGLEFRLRHGLDYGILMRHEHVNTAEEISRVLHYFFKKIQISTFGVAKTFSLYQFYACSEPYREKCHQYLSLHKTEQ